MILRISLLVIVCIAVVVVWRFSSWKRETIRELSSGSQIVNTENGPIEYQIYGDSGDYLLYFHGSPGGYDQYAINSNAFFNSFRVISISRFGYLRTPLTENLSLRDQANTLAGFLKTLEIDKTHIFAGSGGGPLALAFAAYYPEKVQEMTLYAVVSQATNLSNDRPGVKLMKTITRSDFLSWSFMVPLMKKPEKVLRMLIKDTANSDAMIEKGLAEKFARSMSISLPPSLRTPGVDADEELIKNLDIPKENIIASTLIVHGDKDEHVAYEQSVKLEQQLKNAKLLTLKGGDHFAAYLFSDYLTEEYEKFFSTPN